MRRRFVGLLLTLLTLSSLGSAARAQPTALAAPVLKWQYGGCTPPYCETGWYASPAVADLDGDQQPEVIWGDYDLFALNGADGSEQWRAPNGARIWPGIVVADLDGNQTLEIAVGRGQNQLTLYNSAGTELWTRNPFSGGEVRTLAAADLESDGTLELIVGRASSGSSEQVSVYEPDGSVRPGFPARHSGDPGYGAGMYNENVTVADLNNDGNKEIYAPTDTHYITALDGSGNQLAVNGMYAPRSVWSEVGVHVDQAADIRGYAECGLEHRPNFADAAPAIADVNGDGQLELIVPGDVYNCDIGDPDGDLYYLPWILNYDRTRWSGSGYDWTVIPAPSPNSGPLSEDYTVIERSAVNAVVADLDSDGEKEILYPSYDGQVHAYWLDKTEHGQWPFKVPGSGIRFASEPIVVDIDNDGQAEVIFASWPQKDLNLVGQLHVLSAQGQQLFAVDLPAPAEGASWNGGLGAPTIANIDSDPDMEIVVGTSHSGVVAYDLPGSASARVLWGTGRGSYARTGVAPEVPLLLLSVDRDVANIAYGGTASFTLDIGGSISGQATLSASASPDLQLNLSANSVSVPGQATLTVTDQHASSLAPGRWYPIDISISGQNIVQQRQLRVLVDGRSVYLPSLRR